MAHRWGQPRGFQLVESPPMHIHILGICGTFMGGLAALAREAGHRVTGCDAGVYPPMSDQLRALGIELIEGYGAEQMALAPDMYVVGNVVSRSRLADGPPKFALMEAILEAGAPYTSGPQWLAEHVLGTRHVLAVAGTHGKTTTTSMLTEILLDAHKDPTVSVGGMMDAIGGNIRVGSADLFVTEACEYTNSFLSFFPKISVILNMDADHLDFFKDIDDIRHSFRRFAQLLPADGALIINADTLHYQDIIKDLSCKIITYGLEHEAQYQATDITYDKYGHASFTVLKDGRKAGSFYLKVPGSHNVSNALAAIALARLLQIPDDVIVKGLGSFTGTDRRFQYKGEVAGVTIVDDYAHHPTEIQATLNAAHNYPHKKLWCVFQPHTYTRTKALLPEFAKALTLADHVVLADIYAARETDNLGISSQDLQKQIQELGTPCEYFPTFDEIESFLLKSCAHGDLLITMGAGDVVNIGEHLLGK